MASPTTMTMIRPMLPISRTYAGLTARPFSVHVLARFAFWTIFLLSLTNAFGMLVIYLKRLYGAEFELGIYPITFAITAVLVLTFSRGRQSSVILLAAWAFWLAYFLGGFLGTEQQTVSEFRHTLQVTIKPWITFVGLPWLALRAISPHRLPRLIQVTILVTCIGVVLGLFQIIIPGFMHEVAPVAGRASGFWVEPNAGGYLVVMVFFLSFIYPFRARILNFLARFVLLTGVASSFSRASMLALFLAWIVYAISSKRLSTLLKSALGLALFLGATLTALAVIEQMSPESAERVTFVRSFLQGEWSAEKTDNRTEIWKTTIDAIKKGGLIVGLGHGAAARVAGGLAPHNFYLFVWANSGIFALFGLLVFEAVLFQQASRCSDRETRAALLAVATVFVTVFMFDGSVPDKPFPGAVLACTVVAACYTRSGRKVVTARQTSRSLSQPRNNVPA